MLQKNHVYVIAGSIALAFLFAIVWLRGGAGHNGGAGTAGLVHTRSGQVPSEGPSSQRAGGAKDERLAPDPAPDLDANRLALASEDVHKAVGVQWDNLRVDLHLTGSDRAKVRSFVDQMPICGTDLSGEQAEALKDAFVELAHSYGNEDMSGWLKYLQRSGETVSGDRIQRSRQWLIDGGVAPTSVASDGWGVLKQVAEVFHKESRWRGLCLGGGSRIEAFVVNGSSPMPEPGKALQLVRQYKYTFSHLTTPPISPEDVHKERKEVLFADVTIQVLHSDESGGHIQPYVIRSWYDPTNKTWRPWQMSYFPDKDEKVDTNRIPIF